MAGKQATTSKVPDSVTKLILPINVVFYILLLSNTLAASLSPIQDCDETFNYWEPTHYLMEGYGLQTWEYSPEYSIRSWLYVAFHAVIGEVFTPFLKSKSSKFFVIRCILGFICTCCQVRLYSMIVRTSVLIGSLFVIIMAFSPGIFHAATAMLPSSFAMYTSMLGMAAFTSQKNKTNIAGGIMWFAVGAIVGWPFSGVLVGPFLLWESCFALYVGSKAAFVRNILNGALRSLLILGLEVSVDSAFYRKLTVIPWNIVAYNVFGGEGKGPEIYGTEPWTFYFKNLLLNFNIWFPLALAAGPLLILQVLLRPQIFWVRSLFYVLPFYLWFAIFTAQPHKEERFMYPAYPFLVLNASTTLGVVISFILSQRSVLGRRLKFVAKAAVFATILLAVNLGILRIVGMVTAYGAPISVFQALELRRTVSRGDSVCLGKEWYRFPSSFFLPNDTRAKFVKSEFSGLLPSEFNENRSLGLFPGTWVTPEGMNELNIEDPGKYTNISECRFLVDSYFPGNPGSPLEPNYVLEKDMWEEVRCEDFLDGGRTSLLPRIVWTPNLPFIPEPLQRHWGRFCLLRRRGIT